MVPIAMTAARRRIACLFAASLLALPAGAYAQSAGDDQYQDPFGGGEQEAQGGGQEPEPAEPEPAPPPSTSSQPEPAPAAPSATAAQEPQEELPYTGADEGLVALAGVVLLAGGVALRLKT
jgi:LPXTG-motif cell wall-anchored protein